MIPELPLTITQPKFCKKEKQILPITGTLHSVPIENTIFYFHKCNNTTCKHKTSCLYIFSTSYYLCKSCNTLIEGEPLYKISNKTRICKNCGATLMKNTNANVRMML